MPTEPQHTSQEHSHTKEWDEVDRYISETIVGSDPVLEAALVAAEEAGLPSIAVAPNQGKFLHLLALTKGARRISRLERWADTRLSGLPAHCPPAAVW